MSQIQKIGLMYAGCLVYAVVRYVVFVPRNLENLPVFVFNKGLSMAAVLCFAAAFFCRNRGAAESRVEAAAAWFRAGIFGAVVHIPITLSILSPGYFPEFFAGERFSFKGETVFLFGALAAGGIWLLGRQNWTPRHRKWISLATLAALLLHTISMGLARGLNINRSHGWLPPMWLLSAVGIVFGVVFLLFDRSSDGNSREPESGKAGDHPPSTPKG